MCASCGAELRELLIGGPSVRSQPGIIWYIGRLLEQAYGESRLGTIDSSHTDDYGYALLIDDRATTLLARINGTLREWVAYCDPLASMLRHEQAKGGTLPHLASLDLPMGLQARYLAGHLKVIRRREDSRVLYDALLNYAKDAWRIINRPADLCCGPCPTKLPSPPRDEPEYECGTMLYANEHDDTVQCSVCRQRYDVAELREALRERVKDMLFTGLELRRLMETRLNDRIPKATFYKLIADGRLSPRKFVPIKDTHPVKFDAMFTYNDVCEAREKPVPTTTFKSKKNVRTS